MGRWTQRKRLVVMRRTKAAMLNKKTILGMEYPFKECGRPELYKLGRCLECSVREYCESPEKVK